MIEEPAVARHACNRDSGSERFGSCPLGSGHAGGCAHPDLAASILADLVPAGAFERDDAWLAL